MLQNLGRNNLQSIAGQEKTNLVLSGSVNSSCQIMECVEVTTDNTNEVRDEFNSIIEEADQSIIPRVHDSITKGIKRIVSNDTNLVVLLTTFYNFCL